MTLISRMSLIWLVAACVLLLSYWTGWVPYWQAGGYAMLILGSSAVAFLLNGYDKFQARRNGRRISERWLHTFEILGGWPGAYYGQQLFRHKTYKPSYRRLFWIMVGTHVVIVVIALYLSLDRRSQEPDDAVQSATGFSAGNSVCLHGHHSAQGSSSLSRVITVGFSSTGRSV